MSKNYYYIYKTTNIVNNRYYVGIHISSKLNDNYLGSGTSLKLAIKHYGKANFKKDILMLADDYNELIELEKIVVDKDFIEDRSNYNIREGGSGSAGVCGKDNPFYGKTHSLQTRQKIRKAQINYHQNNPNPFKGKSHSEETKAKLSQKNKGRFTKNNCSRLQQKSISMRIGWWYTPFGKFETAKEAAQFSQCCKATVIYRCSTNCDKKVGYHYQVPKEYQGEKTWQEHGWFMIKFGEE